MLELEEARQRILERISSCAAEVISLGDGDRRVLAETIFAPIHLPPFDNSAVDGYAVRAADVADAASNNPVSLRLIGKVPAGQVSSARIEQGKAIRIFTGSPLPEGADSVVMQEDTQAPDGTENILILEAVKPWENIRFQGEDVKTGQPLVLKGVRLGPAHLSLLGAVGQQTIPVAKQPMVALLATGSELRELGQKISGGEIFESNRVGLAALVERAGAIPRIYPLVRDDLAVTRSALEKAFAECDVVITTGGVSVGELDFVKAAFENLGGNLEFWRISMKPGKPFVFGRLENKFLFGLPGNPVSALVTFVLLVAPALLRMQGALNCLPRRFRGTLGEAFANPANRRHFVRVTVDNAGKISSAGTQASHILSSLAQANALLEVAPETTLPVGANVSVLTLE